MKPKLVSIENYARELQNHCSELSKVKVQRLHDFPTLKVDSLTDKVFAGFDLSLTSSGVAFIIQDGISVGLITANIKPKPKMHELDRLVYFSSVFDRLAFCLRTSFFGKQPFVSVEGYAMGVRGGRSFSIGEQGGLFRHKMWLNDFPLTVIAPTSLKKFISGEGFADKALIMKKLYTKFYGIDVDDDDQADASAIALVNLMVHNHENNFVFTRKLALTEYQKDCLKDKKGKTTKGIQLFTPDK